MAVLHRVAVPRCSKNAAYPQNATLIRGVTQQLEYAVELDPCA